MPTADLSHYLALNPNQNLIISADLNTAITPQGPVGFQSIFNSLAAILTIIY